MSDISTPHMHISGKTPAPEALAAATADAVGLLQRCAVEQSDRAILKALEIIGQARQADRAYVFLMTDELSLRNTHEWCAKGINPAQSMLQQVPHNVADTFWKAFRKSGALALGDTTQIPVGSELRQSLDAQGIKSLIATPLWQDGDMMGFVGLDFVRHHQDFNATDESLLRAFAASVALSLRLEQSHSGQYRLQADLQTERARISALVSALPELLVETDADGIITGFHQSDPLIFALHPEEVVGQPPEGVLPAAAARIARKAMKEADHFGWSQSFSYSLPFPEHEKRFSMTVTRRQQGAARQRPGYLFLVRDITESYRQDQQNRQLVRVAELSTNLIMLTDAQLRITWVNPSCIARTGTTAQSAIGQKPSEILNLAQSDPNAVTEIHNQIVSGYSVNREIRARSKHGTDFWLDMNLQPLRNPEGDIQGYMIVGVDITAHKLAEARALRDRMTAMEASQEGLAILTAEGRFIYINNAMRSFLTLPDDAPLADLYWHQTIPPHYSTIMHSIMDELLAKGYWSGEFNVSDQSGQDSFHELSMSVQDDSSIFVIARDITARRRALAERAALHAQLQIAQSRQLMAQLAGGLAHDFANTLSVISGSVELLQSRLDADEAVLLGRIRAASEQAQALARSLMTLGSPRQSRTATSVQRVLRHTVDLLRPAIPDGITLSLDLPPADIVVQADSTEMMQVFINLLMNAADAIASMDTGSGLPAPAQITLGLKMRPAGQDSARTCMVGAVAPDLDYGVIEITDSGPGIPDADRDKIFKPYFSTKHDHGTGLGLTIVAHLLQAHQAALDCLDAPDGGTLMRIFWPLGTVNAEQGPVATPRDNGEPRPLEGRNILLVDDDDTVLQALSRHLSDSGAEVASCTDPKDAIDAVRDAPGAWDIVVTDHDMGAITGVELAQQIRLIRPDIKLFLISGTPELHFAKESVKLLFDSCLSKPVSGATLISHLVQD